MLVRPEQILLSENAHNGRAVARVLETEFYGHDAVVRLRATGSEPLLLSARTPNPIRLPHVDDEVCLEVLGPVVAWPRDTTRN